jgi:ABC-type multidrug transport system permease subunit
MEPLVKLMPTYWLNRAFRQVTVYRAPVSAVAVDVAVLGAIAVVTIAFASWRFGRLKQVA